MPTSLIVVTDLDGTLLDHHSYQYSAALPALEKLRESGIPLILNSSKTASEMQRIRHEMDNHDPYIVENGAGIYLSDPKQSTVEASRRVDFGMNRADIIQIVRDLRSARGFNFTGFADMDVATLVGYTGLDEDRAQLALQRSYTEPVLWQDSQARFEEFSHALTEQGITLVRGGRFIHLSSGVDKGAALTWLRDYYGKDQERPPAVIALGVGENDRTMLQQADYPVIIKSPVNKAPEVTHPELIRTELEGPAGWNEAILQLLGRLIS